MVSSTIGGAVRSARERAGWSRETLAHHSGLSCAAIAQIESGRRQDVRLASLVALARALDVSVDYLAAERRAAGARPLLEHRALVYSTDSEYLAAAGPFFVEGVERGEGLLAVTSRRQIRLLRKHLGAATVHVEFRDSSEWYRSPTHALTGYRAYVADRVESGARWIRILGEPVWARRSQSEVAAWTRYESILNLSLSSAPATIMCPYDTRSVPQPILDEAHETHPELADGGAVLQSDLYRQPEDFLLA